MEEQRNEATRPVNPRRRKRSKFKTFLEAYLPVVIAAVALVLIVVFIAGSISRSKQQKQAEIDASIAASIALQQEHDRLSQQAQELIQQSESYLPDYDYAGAIALLNTFEGDISQFPALNDKILEYENAQKNMVAWDDPSKVTNLSFQLLLADPQRGFNDSTYGSLINRNFVTTEEFSKILQQLYENGYMLVRLSDIISMETGADGSAVYKAKTLYLPKGKKPLLLTQTNVNYNYYLIDSNGDKLADANGRGIASKLLWDGNTFTCEMVDASGNKVTGDYDLVPILEKFVAAHPTFSYRGAKAILALTGYNGLFGYRTHPMAANFFGEDARQKDITDVKVVADALRSKGYTLACYTYENIAYGDSSLNAIKYDLQQWTDEVVPILGNIDILVYAQMTDIAAQGTYSGDKFNILQSTGFRYYFGFCNEGTLWANVEKGYVRMGRLMVTGSTMAHHADWFTELFDSSTILDSSRGTIPK